MSKSKPILPYSPEKVAEIRSWTKDCATWLEARDLIATKLGVGVDNVTRSHKRHGFWDAASTRTDVSEALRSKPLVQQNAVLECQELVADCLTWYEARGILSKRLNISPSRITFLSNRLKEQGITLWSPKISKELEAIDPTIISHGDGDTFDAEVETSKVATLDEVIELCKIDTGKWENKGFTVRRGAKGFAWNARFARKTELDSTAVMETFVNAASEHSPRKWVINRALAKEADCLYVLNLQDLHLGKLAQSRETGGADWDIKIAERTYREAVKELMDKAPAARIDEVVVIVGSDMLQIDNDRSETSKGTYVDSDSRLSKVFDTAARMLTDVIEELASQFKVRVVVIAGNHDSVTSHFLGRYVESWFRAHSNVRVDASPCSRKYVGYGKTLIAFDHGDETKPKDLPLIVMRENQSTISQYRFIEALVGHTHHEESNDIKGIVVRVAPALCSADKWHARAGLVGAIRRSQGLLYQREDGLEAIYYSTPLD